MSKRDGAYTTIHNDGDGDGKEEEDGDVEDLENEDDLDAQVLLPKYFFCNSPWSSCAFFTLWSFYTKIELYWFLVAGFSGTILPNQSR